MTPEATAREADRLLCLLLKAERPPIWNVAVPRDSDDDPDGAAAVALLIARGNVRREGDFARLTARGRIAATQALADGRDAPDPTPTARELLEIIVDECADLDADRFVVIPKADHAFARALAADGLVELIEKGTGLAARPTAKGLAAVEARTG